MNDKLDAARDTTNKWWSKIDPDIAEILIEFNITLSDKKVYRDFRIDVNINYELLEDDLETMPSVYSFWSAILSEQKKKVKHLELKLDIKRSKLLTEISKNIKDGVRFTKDDKDNIINVDVDVTKLKIELINAESTLSKLFGIVESLKMKSDHLRSLAGFKRVELSGS
jgi:transcription initiation factor IIF auxiliary subunit